MPHTIRLILPVLQYVAAGGAGAVASYLVAIARLHWPQPSTVPAGASGLFYRTLYAPRYTRMFVLILAGILGTLAAGAVAYFTGANVAEAIDVATAGALAGIASQILHGLTLSSELPPLDEVDRPDDQVLP